jgi:hypothetical protein
MEVTMKLLLAASSLLIASTAYAQAPGEYEEGTGAPGMAPVVVEPVVAPPVKQRRWSVGLGFGSLGLSPHDNPDAETNYGIGQLALRYRPWRHLEIELAFSGGREQLDDGEEGDRMVNQGVLALRYRFAPQRRWNWWLMAGMGSLAVTTEGASDEQREAAHQSTLQFGAGIERRWSRFALQFELRAVGVAPNEDEDMAVPEPYGMPVYDSAYTQDGWAGGQFVFSGNYYF